MASLFNRSLEMPVHRDGRADFDFLAGRWQVTHRRLKTRLRGDTAWETFGGAVEVRPIIGGLGNIDDNIIDLPDGAYRASSLRLFDPAAGRWSIWWIDARSPRLDPPVHGAFQDGVGTFLGDDALDGLPIRVRFRWSGTASAAPRWEQAFSADEGVTWEPNWTMDFSRA